MKLHLAQAPGQNLFTGYGTGYVAINAVRHERPVLVTAGKVTPWNVARVETLQAAHVQELVALAPEIVILGTGARLHFPPPEFARSFSAAGIGLEVMDSKAACRTYNVLVAEGRRVVAAILIA